MPCGGRRSLAGGCAAELLEAIDEGWRGLTPAERRRAERKADELRREISELDEALTLSIGATRGSDDLRRLAL